MRSSIRQILFLCGGAALLLAASCTKGGIEGKFKNTRLEGTFTSTNDKLGSWTLSPAKCLAGKELGFQGIAFQFEAGSPVEDLRIDTARDGDNLVIVHLDDREGTTYRVHERECDEITGSIENSHLTLNGRPMLRLDGVLHFACPDHGLSGKATFGGCLPETVH